MVEEKIDPEILTANFERNLAADEGKANTKLDEKLAEVGKEPSLKVAFLRFLRKRQEVEVVEVLDELLSKIGCGLGSVAWKFVIPFPCRR